MSTQVTERPILYTGPMVLAILDDRKTMTRRAINRLAGFGLISQFGRSDTPGYDWHFRDKRMHWNDISHKRLLECCPYGKPGDRLWGRETFRLFSAADECGCSEAPCPCPQDGTPIYRATHDDGDSKWKPSIFMSRWASRILLEITDVRVEQLNEISEEDAIAEGVEYFYAGFFKDYLEPREDIGISSAIGSFTSLWESINGDGSFDDQWVWVIRFRRVERILEVERVLE